MKKSTCKWRKGLVMTGSFCFLSMLAPNVVNAQNPLSPAFGFNVFLEKNATLVTNETDGAIAIGGDLSLKGNYQLTTNSTGTFKISNVPIGLLVAGKINYLSGGGTLYVNSGAYVKIGDCTGSKVWYKDNNGANGNLQVTKSDASYGSNPRISLQTSAQNLGVSQTTNPVNQGNLIDFTSAFTQMKATSQSIGVCTNNATLTNPNGGSIPNTNLPQQVKINLHTGTNVLNVTGTDLNKVSVFTYNNKPDANHVLVINVNAPGAFTWTVWNQAGIGNTEASYVLYNFYNTTSLNVAGNSTVTGSLFAPFADVNKTTNQSNIQGQVVAQSYYQGGGENHNSPFIASIQGCAIPCTIAADGIVSNIKCYADNSGTIDLNVIGANGAVTYTWADAVTTEDRINLSAGNYSVTVKDANNCTATKSFTITQPQDALQIYLVNKTQTDTLGNCNATAVVNITGGTQAYRLAWDDAYTDFFRSDLCEGNHSVVVTDANACTASLQFEIERAIPPPQNPDTKIVQSQTIITTAAVYPNPTKGRITFNIESKENKTAILNVYDMNGKKVITQNSTLSQGSNTKYLDMSMLQKGMYIVEIVSGKEKKSMHIIVQ